MDEFSNHHWITICHSHCLDKRNHLEQIWHIEKLFWNKRIDLFIEIWTFNWLVIEEHKLAKSMSLLPFLLFNSFLNKYQGKNLWIIASIETNPFWWIKAVHPKGHRIFGTYSLLHAFFKLGNVLLLIKSFHVEISTVQLTKKGSGWSIVKISLSINDQNFWSHQYPHAFGINCQRNSALYSCCNPLSVRKYQIKSGHINSSLFASFKFSHVRWMLHWLHNFKGISSSLLVAMCLNCRCFCMLLLWVKCNVIFNCCSNTPSISVSILNCLQLSQNSSSTSSISPSSNCVSFWLLLVPILSICICDLMEKIQLDDWGTLQNDWLAFEIGTYISLLPLSSILHLLLLTLFVLFSPPPWKSAVVSLLLWQLIVLFDWSCSATWHGAWSMISSKSLIVFSTLCNFK